MALVADVMLPPPPPALPPAGPGTIWIATITPPWQTQSWPLNVPIPGGWREVSYREALALKSPGPISFLFTPEPPPTSLESEAAALSTAAPSLAAVAARSLPRTPREARFPRASRPARAPRPERLPRAPRAPRSSRRPRVPRRARAIRPIRKPRPKNYKTKQKPGVCKGPGCTCWTPAGCAGDWYLELLPWFAASDCFRGPCYDYTACVSDKCQVHAACAINEIIQFWARKYRAVVAYTEPVTTPALAAARFVAGILPGIGLLQQVGQVLDAPELGGVTVGCPPGEYWTIGLTGCRCVPRAFNLKMATEAEVIACIGQAAWDQLVTAGVQGQTG